MKTGLAVGVFIVWILLIHGCSWFKTQTDRPEDLGYITGRILDSNGDPIESAIVRVDTLGRQAVTDNLGWYRLEIPKGTWDVTIYKSGFRDELREGVFVLPDKEINVGVVRLDTDEHKPAEVRSRKATVMPAEDRPQEQGYGKLSGIIIEKETGRRVSGVRVWVSETKYEGTSDKNGEFYIIPVPPGEYHVEAAKIGYRNTIVQDVLVRADLTTRLGEIALQKSTEKLEPIVVKAERRLMQLDVTATTRITSKEELDSMPVHPFQEILDERTSSESTDESLHVRGGRGGEAVYQVDRMKIEDPLTRKDNQSEPAYAPLPEPPPGGLGEEAAGKGYDATDTEAPETTLRRAKSSKSPSSEVAELELLSEGFNAEYNGKTPNGTINIKKIHPQKREDEKQKRVASPPPWKTMGIGTELWIIEARESNVPYDESYESPQLKAVLPESQEEIPLPLKHTDVKAQIDAYIATAVVTQEYHNPYDEKIEAVYVFPLPQNAAVTDFLMIIGDREIRGMIREREQAERIYEEAKSRGYRAAILTQERPNIFTQKVANIEPGHDINIQTTFFNTLDYVDGEFEFVFPTVVGPKFNPDYWTDGVTAVPAGKEGTTDQPVEIGYMNHHQSSGHSLSIVVDINTGSTIEDVYSRSHLINIDREGKTRAVVSLDEKDVLPNKDFVLRYRTANKHINAAFLTHPADDGNYFSLIIEPPISNGKLSRITREITFVVDCSSSMEGEPLSRAKTFLRHCIKSLTPEDTYQIIRFSKQAKRSFEKALPATNNNIEQGLRVINGLRAYGGTMMIHGLRAGLEIPTDGKRLRMVILVSDGHLANETEVFQTLREMENLYEWVGESRIFCVGVGSAVNRYLMERLAKLGRGAVGYIGLNSDAQEVAGLFIQKIGYPPLTDVHIDWDGLAVADVFPKVLPDLFAGRPIMVTGRTARPRSAKIRISGRCGNHTEEMTIETNPGAGNVEHNGIRSIWARYKLEELSLREIYSPSDTLREEIISASIHYGLMSKYTSFLAVDSFEKTVGDTTVTVHVPVEMPEGMQYESNIRQSP